MKRLSLVWIMIAVAGCTQRSPSLPQRQCPPIDDTFEADYIPDADIQSSYRLVEFFNKGIFPTPIATAALAGESTTIRVECKVHNRQDVTNDDVPEIFLTTTIIPDEATDLVGMWTDYLILSCSDGSHMPVFLDTYQHLYHHYSVEVISDTNDNTLPEVQILDINTHWVAITRTVTLEWNGRELEVMEENRVYGPTETPFP